MINLFSENKMILRFLKSSSSSLFKHRNLVVNRCLYSTECVNILGVPSKAWNNKTYQHGQFFINKKTPYRGIILGEVKAEERNIDELPNHTCTRVIHKLDFSFMYKYTVYIVFADFFHVQCTCTSKS